MATVASSLIIFPLKLKEGENETLSQVKKKKNYLIVFHWFRLGDVPIPEPITMEWVAPPVIGFAGVTCCMP